MDYPGKVITKTQVTPTQISASGNWTLDDQAAAIKNNNWPVAGVPNPISKSLRFNSADSAYLNRTFTSTGNRRIFTWSGWIKILKFGTNPYIFSTGASSAPEFISISSGDQLNIGYWNGSTYVYRVQTTQVFRDPSAWYHIVVAWDTTQATAANRLKIYVNGSQVTALSVSSYPSQNYDSNLNTAAAHYTGSNVTSAYFDGYMTEINFIDGQALTPSSFGMTNPQTGQWIPIKYSGTYGTNGFYVNFKDATSTTTLGYDYSGNANNWTTNNFSVTAGSGNDSLTDVPTPWVAYNTTGDVGGVVRGNYCTANPLKKPSTSTITNGNLDVAHTSAGGEQPATFAFSSGKWYWEVSPNSGVAAYGIILTSVTPSASSINNGYHYYGGNGQFYTGTSGVAYGATFTNGDVIGVALNLDTNQITFYKNGVSQGAQSISAGEYNPDIAAASTNTTNCNFGQRPFAYTPPAGFLSLCTTNLPATTIGFGLTNQGDDYFNTVLYTGNGSNRSITGVGFQPDFVWIKKRSGIESHALSDVLRGTNRILISDSTAGDNTAAGTLTAFNSDGFSLGTQGIVNDNTFTFTSWNWKAGGTGVSNTSGSISSTVSASTTAGFSVVTYTGNGTNGATVGHGLGAVPRMIIIKGRDTGYNWRVYHASLGNTGGVFLNTTAAFTSTSGYWNDTTPTSTVFTIGTDAGMNQSAATYVAYCFAPVAGYSAFGSYTGNGSTDGPFVYLGFRPAMIWTKPTSETGNWNVLDNKRGTYNVNEPYLAQNSTAAEATVAYVDFLSNGFKIRYAGSTPNNNGATIIYAAFAEAPFQFANAR